MNQVYLMKTLILLAMLLPALGYGNDAAADAFSVPSPQMMVLGYNHSPITVELVLRCDGGNTQACLDYADLAAGEGWLSITTIRLQQACDLGNEDACATTSKNLAEGEKIKSACETGDSVACRVYGTGMLVINQNPIEATFYIKKSCDIAGRISCSILKEIYDVADQATIESALRTLAQNNCHYRINKQRSQEESPFEASCHIN
jgi:hypothetical protein